MIVRTFRALFSMSQTDLARASGVSRPTINRVETQRDLETIRTATLEALLAVFRRLGVDLKVKEHQMVFELPLESVTVAIQAGKTQGKKTGDNPGKALIMERAKNRPLIGDGGPTFEREELEALMRDMHQISQHALDTQKKPGSNQES